MTALSRRRFNRLFAAGVGSAIAAPYVANAQAADKIRFCWTNSVAVTSQVHHSMKNTNIASSNGIDLEMIQFFTGPAINEALVSGAGDIGSVADFGAMLTMAVGAPLEVIGHQSSFRSALLASKKSGIKTIADLKGKQVYGMFGVTAYLNAQEAVRAAGLKVGTDVTFVNIGITELFDAVRAQRIDAFFVWDPWVTLFEHNDFGVVLAQNLSPSMVLLARSELVKKKPEMIKRFLRGHSEALYFASQNHDLTNKWFRSMEPAKSLPVDVIERASTFDPQWSAKSFTDITTAISPTSILDMQRMADWAQGEKLLPKAPKVRDFINNEIASAVDSEAKTKPFDVSSVKINS